MISTFVIRNDLVYDDVGKEIGAVTGIAERLNATSRQLELTITLFGQPKWPSFPASISTRDSFLDPNDPARAFREQQWSDVRDGKVYAQGVTLTSRKDILEAIKED